MNFRLLFLSAACLSIVVAPASSISLLAAAAAVKGVVLGAGLSALSSGGSETVIIQSQPGSVAELVPANQVILQDLHKPVTVQTAQTITYTSGNPISRLWGAVSNVIVAKAKAISDLFRPNRVVILLPQTIEEPPKPTTPVITIELEQKPGIEVDLGHKPLLPSINVDLGNKPSLPSINVDLGNKPSLPSINVDLGNKPSLLSINVDLGNKPSLPSINVDLGNKPSLPSINVDLVNKPSLPSINVDVNRPINVPLEVSASIGRGSSYRRMPMAVVNYLMK